MSVTLVKKSAMKSVKAPGARRPPGDFILTVDQDDVCTVHGVDSHGNPVDISDVATLAAVSSDPSVLAVDAPVGMSFKMRTVGPIGSSVVTATATWNDGSIGPFGADLPVGVVAGAAGGLVIEPGVPTPH